MDYIEFEANKLGDKIGVGGTAVVFAYDDNQVIKIFNRNFDLNNVKEEYSRSLVAEHSGLPAPKNYGICQVSNTGVEAGKDFQGTIDGCYAYLQERIQGISLMKKIMENPAIEASGMLITDMVGLQVKMHEIAADKYGLRNQRDVLHLHISWAPLLTMEEKQKLDMLLDSLPEGNSICHGDYHMDNVIITQNGLVCIDWNDLTCGNPMADLARSLLIFLCEGVPESIPKEVVELTIRMRSICYDYYLETYKKLGGKVDQLEKWLVVTAAARICFEVDDNKQCMLRVVRDYFNKK